MFIYIVNDDTLNSKFCSLFFPHLICLFRHSVYVISEPQHCIKNTYYKYANDYKEAKDTNKKKGLCHILLKILIEAVETAKEFVSHFLVFSNSYLK